jgi:hypothetical protein
MSRLIDSFSNCRALIYDKWYIAKPMFSYTLTEKVKDCFGILKGTAIGVHFKEDELKKDSHGNVK